MKFLLKQYKHMIVHKNFVKSLDEQTEINILNKTFHETMEEMLLEDPYPLDMDFMIACAREEAFETLYDDEFDDDEDDEFDDE